MINRKYVESKILQATSLSNVNGYVKKIEDNLLPNIDKRMFVGDLSKGKGNELESKFKSIFSSSALAVNNFALIKENVEVYSFNGLTNFSSSSFEKEFSTGLKGTPPTLDFYLENSKTVLGFESKYLEYFDIKMAEFKKSYFNLKFIENSWIDLMNKYQNTYYHLDVAQLIKHSFGLINYGIKLNKKPILIFIYWLPANFEEVNTCSTLLNELVDFSNDMKKQNQIDFIYISYFEFWEKHMTNPIFKEHINNMRTRYGGIYI